MMTTEYETPMEAVEASQHHPWSEDWAQRIAMEDGVGELTETHWKVIHTLREHFVKYGALPPMGLACGMNELDPDCADELFHGAHEARQVAGLPEPGSEYIGCM